MFSQAKKGHTVRVTLTDMAYGGDAVGRDPDTGIAVFAWPGISGEEVNVDINWRRPNLVRGVVTAVERASELRVEPLCPYFGACGGCQWQHIEYAGQVAFKHDILRSQLMRTGGVTDPEGVLKPPMASPHDYGYRNTSHFAIDPQARSLAYFKRNSRSLIAVDLCPISNRGINLLIPRLNALLASMAPAEELSREPRGIMRVWKIAIRHSEVTEQTVIVFHTRPGGHAVAMPARNTGRRSRTQTPVRPDDGPNMEVNPDANPVFPMRRRDVKKAVNALALVEGLPGLSALTVIEAMDDGTVNLLGATKAAGAVTSEAMADTLTGAYVGDRGQERGLQGYAPPLGAWLEHLGGRNYWVAPHAFFQVNTAGAELMLAQIVENIPQGLDLLVDAHAGVGTFAFALAGHARRVLAFETDAASVASARWTALVGSFANVEFKQGKAELLLAALPDGERPDAVVFDPPRAGCSPWLLAEVLKREVPRLVYVSCDPSTLARDIKILSEKYALSSARVIDMFPQTYHIETVAVLDLRQNLDAPR